MAELILALDLPEKDAALHIARQVRGIVPWCKVGMEMFTRLGPDFLHQLRELDFKIFLDLKFYDIPHTVAQAVKSAGAIGVDLLSLHCQGGERMCRAAREAADSLPAERRPLLFGVTVLTSFANGEMPGITAHTGEFAQYLALQAQDWGLDGVVCSAQEVALIKSQARSLRCLCPGIRPQGSSSDDQRRVMTPARAVDAGADFLVVGRPILQAAEPAKAARLILTEMHHPAQSLTPVL